MYGIIEAAIVLLILATICMSPTTKSWLATVKRSDFWTAVAIVFCLFVGQFSNISRTTFPFVRWSMYTEKFDEPIVVSKFQAVCEDGTVKWINPTTLYPSISRNLEQRLAVVLQRCEEGKLSEQLDSIFKQFMIALGQRFQRVHADSSVVEVRAILQKIVVCDDQARTADVLVKTVDLSGTQQYANDVLMESRSFKELGSLPNSKLVLAAREQHALEEFALECVD